MKISNELLLIAGLSMPLLFLALTMITGIEPNDSQLLAMTGWIAIFSIIFFIKNSQD